MDSEQANAKNIHKNALRCDFVEFDVVMFLECFENVWEFNGKCHTFVSMDFKNLQCRTRLVGGVLSSMTRTECSTQ